MYRVLRKKVFKLFVELGRKRFIVRDHQRGSLDAVDNIRHGECLARPGHAQKRLMPHVSTQVFHKAFDRLRLIAGRLKRTFEFEARNCFCVRLTHATLYGTYSSPSALSPSAYSYDRVS